MAKEIIGQAINGGELRLLSPHCAGASVDISRSLLVVGSNFVVGCADDASAAIG